MQHPEHCLLAHAPRIAHRGWSVPTHPPVPPNSAPCNRTVQKVPHGRVTRVQAAGSSSHQLVVVRVPAPRPTRHTILHSHGNAVDLGEMLPLYASLARVLQCNVVGWDYRGWECKGCEGGQTRGGALAWALGRAKPHGVMSGL